MLATKEYSISSSQFLCVTFKLHSILPHGVSASCVIDSVCVCRNIVCLIYSCLLAGTVMFEYGMRLGREVRTLGGLEKQGNCYLAAINCLRLIRPEYAWIVQPASGAVV